MVPIKEIVVVSGKGGSGKTVFAASLAYLFHQEGFKVMAADVDVDTPTLHFMLPIKRRLKRYEIYMSRKAVIDVSKCTKCMRCVETCPYEAIVVDFNGLRVEPFYCEGCSACAHVCPVSAASMKESRTGSMIFAETEFGFPIFTAQLEIGEHSTGPLVNELRERAREIAKEQSVDILVVDGSPGIGCTIISSIVGADYVVLVSEPTPQSLRGAFRAAKIAQQFRVCAGFVLNKSMGYPVEDEVEKMLSIMNARLIGKIPYDYAVVESLTMLKPVVAYKPDSPASRAIRIAYENVKIGTGIRRC
ncbi:MAG: ATP-binding protein [Candidatus Nezhaarchaeota archaeon]|nr:ATP-binding protein [Candidatus Nezhaarchaeota archaeon]